MKLVAAQHRSGAKESQATLYFFYGIGNCSQCSGTPTKMPLAFLLGECAGIPLFGFFGSFFTKYS
jgi:hypothetical protein